MDSEAERVAADRIMRTLAEPTAAPLDPQRDLDRVRVERALFGVDAVHAPTIGRYELREAVGEGAMGEVFRAFDPVLQRDVAIKIVHRSLLGQGSGGAARLLLEARSLARLSHPNVVAVHETGIDEHGRAWIAMELVDGSNLRRWLRDRERSTNEILEVLVQAGRGLAAAHAAGLVHRDVKPDNVLVDRAGRVRVGDFGVVRSAGPVASSADEPSRPSGDSSSSTPGSSVAPTRPRALIGTVAYMSPEQLAGDEELDPRGDQFSFCVMAWEALWGMRPFPGGDANEMRASIFAGALRRPRAGKRVPSRVARALRRGLAARREDRFANLEALLRQLRRPRRTLALAMAGCVALGGAALAGRSLVPEHGCDSARAQLEGAWDDRIASEVRSSLLATDVAYADAVAATVVAELSARSSAWIDAWERLCEVRRIEAESIEQTDRSMACLSSRRADLAAIARALQRSDPSAVERAIDGVSALPDPERCLSLSPAHEVPPESVRARLDPLLATARALHAAGDPEVALPLTELADVIATQEGAPGYAIEARMTAAELRLDLGDYDGAAHDWIAAINNAIATADDEASAAGWIRAARAAADSLRDPERARLWLGHASAAVQRLGDRAARLALPLALSNASVTAIDDPAAALAIAEEIERVALPGDIAQSDTARMARQLAASLALDLGDFDDAESRYRALIEEQRDRYGDEHPRTGDAWYGLGIALDRRGDSNAKAAYRRALQIWSHSVRGEHRDVGAAHIALANVAMREHQYDAAREHLVAARGIYEKTLPAADVAFGEIWTAEGVLLHRGGEFAAAATAHDRARRVYEEQLGEGAINTAIARSNAAEARLRAGVGGQAAEFDAARVVIEANCGAACPIAGYPLKGLGLIALGEHRCEAIELLEDAASRLAKLDAEDAREAAIALRDARTGLSHCGAD